MIEIIFLMRVLKNCTFIAYNETSSEFKFTACFYVTSN